MTPPELAAERDLISPRFRAGEKRGWWRKLRWEFPKLHVAVSATGLPETEYHFAFNLDDFPISAPLAQIIDPATGLLLPVARRPNSTPKLQVGFQSWGDETVYRPWERKAGAHNNWTQTYKALAWRVDRELAFCLEDLHDLLDIGCFSNSNWEAA